MGGEKPKGMTSNCATRICQAISCGLLYIIFANTRSLPARSCYVVLQMTNLRFSVLMYFNFSQN